MQAKQNRGAKGNAGMYSSMTKRFDGREEKKVRFQLSSGMKSIWRGVAMLKAETDATCRVIRRLSQSRREMRMRTPGSRR